MNLNPLIKSASIFVGCLVGVLLGVSNSLALLCLSDAPGRTETDQQKPWGQSTGQRILGISVLLGLLIGGRLSLNLLDQVQKPGQDVIHLLRKHFTWVAGWVGATAALIFSATKIIDEDNENIKQNNLQQIWSNKHKALVAVGASFVGFIGGGVLNLSIFALIQKYRQIGPKVKDNNLLNSDVIKMPEMISEPAKTILKYFKRSSGGTTSPSPHTVQAAGQSPGQLTPSVRPNI